MLFSAVSSDIKEENVSLNQNIWQCNTLYRTLYESKAENESVHASNPLTYTSFADANVTEDKRAVLTDYFTSYPEAYNNLVIFWGINYLLLKI